MSALPSWEGLDGFALLSAVGWYVDAVFNRHQLRALDREISQWLQLVEKGEVEGVSTEITGVREIVELAATFPCYVVFQGW